LRIEAVVFNPQNPFTWSSGIKSPIYCDNRLLLSYPELRQAVKNALASVVEQADPRIDAVAGVATAGIPHATMIADQLALPLAYVRSSPKKHGTGNKVEGRLEKGQNVAVIEDLISTGGSSMSAIDTVREIGCRVSKVTAIFSYDFDRAIQRFEDNGVKVETLTNYSILTEVAQEKGYIPESAFDTLEAWRADPDSWGAK